MKKAISNNEAAIARKEAAQKELNAAIAALQLAIKTNEITEENVANARKRVAKARKDFAAATKHAKDTALLVPKVKPAKKDLDSIVKLNSKKHVVKAKAPVKVKSVKKAAPKTKSHHSDIALRKA
jgi:exonuclease VII small subunit